MIKVHPADGLINRLLQQNSRPETSMSDATASVRILCDIVKTTGARKSEVQEVRQVASERQLESQLLRLYRDNVRTKGRS